MSALGEAFSSSSLSSSGSSHRSKLSGLKHPKPASLERTSSIISLPSPPDEFQQGPRKPSFICLNDEPEENELTDVSDDQVDMLASSPELNNERDEFTHEKTESNPFLVPAQRQYQKRNNERLHELGAGHPQSSPTHQKKRRIDVKDKNRLEKSAANTQANRLSGGKVTGWDSPGNPFVERADAQTETRAWKQGDGKKPEKVTYVFRGKRVTYDMPLDALLAPEDPDDDTFPDPSPRLLFPVGPSSPTTNSNNPVPVTPPSIVPPSSFLNALRATATKREGISSQSLGLPPTPVTERRSSKKSQHETRFEPYKKSAAK